MSLTPSVRQIAAMMVKASSITSSDSFNASVRYEAVNAMLLNEFLKEHGKVQELEKQVEKLTAGLQKVTAQMEASKPATQMAANNQ